MLVLFCVALIRLVLLLVLLFGTYLFWLVWEFHLAHSGILCCSYGHIRGPFIITALQPNITVPTVHIVTHSSLMDPR